MLSDKFKFFFPIYSWVKTAWRGVSVLTQPHELVNSQSNIVEIGTTAGIIDYQNISSLTSTVDLYFASLSNAQNKSLTLSLGLFQESAARFLPKLEGLLGHTVKTASINSVQISHLKLNDLEAVTEGAISTPPPPPEDINLTSLESEQDLPAEPRTDLIDFPNSQSLILTRQK